MVVITVICCYQQPVTRTFRNPDLRHPIAFQERSRLLREQGILHQLRQLQRERDLVAIPGIQMWQNEIKWINWSIHFTSGSHWDHTIPGLKIANSAGQPDATKVRRGNRSSGCCRDRTNSRALGCHDARMMPCT